MQGLNVKAAAIFFLAGTAGARRETVGAEERLFADGEDELPQKEGAWKHSVTRKIAYEEIGRCYDPSQDWGKMESAGSAAPWEEPLEKAVSSARGLPDMPHAQALARTVNSIQQAVGDLAKILPQHRAVGLTSQRAAQVPPGQHLPDSHCFLFDYQSFKESDPDPHGCGFFRRSFQPLQELRQCIVGKLEADPAWQAYNTTAGRIIAAREDGSRGVDNPAVLDDHERAIAQANVDVAFDSIRRADEIVKTVSFKPWESMTAGDAAKVVEAKVSKTVITTNKMRVIKQETVESIRTDCFLVTGDATDALPERALALKRALPCYQLMWDQIEVAGPPEQPMSNAITMWDRSLSDLGRVEKDYDTPPVCARAAVALVAEKQKRATHGYSWSNCIARRPRWKECADPKSFNCICFQFCWRRALERLCEIQPGCCWTPQRMEVASALPRD